MNDPLLWSTRLSLIPTFKFPNLTFSKCSLREWFAWTGVCAIASLSLIGFFAWVNPSLTGENALRIGADSNFYLWQAGMRRSNPYGADNGDDAALIGYGSNVLGPIIIARVLKSNVLILCLNILIMGAVVCILARTRSLRVGPLLLLLLLNPAVLVSILTLNKEILALLATALLSWYLARERQSKLLLFATLLVSLCARWEHLVLVLGFVLVSAKWNPLSRYRKSTLGLIIVFLSVLYPLMSSWLNGTFPIGESRVINALGDLQDHGLFFAVVLPKTIFNLFWPILGIFHHDAPSWDLYNNYISPYSSLMNLIVLLAFLMHSKFRVRDDLLYFAGIYLIVLALPLFSQSRYLLPVYLILCVAVTTRLPDDRTHKCDHLYLSESFSTQ